MRIGSYIYNLLVLAILVAATLYCLKLGHTGFAAAFAGFTCLSITTVTSVKTDEA